MKRHLVIYALADGIGHWKNNHRTKIKTKQNKTKQNKQNKGEKGENRKCKSTIHYFTSINTTLQTTRQIKLELNAGKILSFFRMPVSIAFHSFIDIVTIKADLSCSVCRAATGMRGFKTRNYLNLILSSRL